MARDLAGFTAGQGEQLRRALGAKDGALAVERYRELFLAGAAANGVSADVATRVFDQLRAFGSYSFTKSHAAAFAVRDCGWKSLLWGRYRECCPKQCRCLQGRLQPTCMGQ
ncbi:MAG: hypothetical protein IPL78_12095 [Chloroflexi bacterium]|nr:hypothetical protein [Chloroflexota bacterium]